MAAASYTTDLAIFKDFESATTLGEMIGYTLSGAPALDTDYPIQSTQHASAAMTKTGLGSIVADYGSNVTWTSGWAFFMWGVFTAPAAVNSFTNGGLRFLLGSDITTNYKGWKVGGNDFGRYPYGGWQNFAVDPETAADYSGGTLAGYRWAGIGVDCIAAIGKGVPIGVDVIRFGRGQLLVTGGDVTNGYGTFAGMAAANDASAARWGLFQQEGKVYRWKGLISLGSASTAVDFRDSNRDIYIDDTQKVLSSFNRIEISNTGSRVDFTGISITALGTNSKGQIEMIDACTVNDSGGTFTDMDTFIFKSGGVFTGRTWRRCGAVTLGGATFTDCFFDKPSGTVGAIAASPAHAALITGTTFVSDGTGHAIEITGTAADISLDGDVFTGYAASNGSTGNEAIFVNIATGTMTINITGGGSTPSIRTAGATVTVQNAVTVAITVKDATTLAPIENARVLLEKVSDGTDIVTGLTNASGIVTTSYAYTADTAVTGTARRASAGYGTLYQPGAISGTITAAGFSTTILLNSDE